MEFEPKLHCKKKQNVQIPTVSATSTINMSFSDVVTDTAPYRRWNLVFEPWSSCNLLLKFAQYGVWCRLAEEVRTHPQTIREKKNDCLRLPWIDPLLWINYAQWSNSTSRLRRGSALPLSGWRMWTSSGGRSLPWNWNPSGGWSALPLSWRILQHVDRDSRHSKLLPSTCWYNRMPRKVRMIRHD